MKQAAFFVGIAAVILYFLGYLQKKRGAIIFLNASSRLLYIIQYFLLSAFTGAVLDIAGILSSFLAGAKNKPFIRNHTKLFVLTASILITVAGLLTYENVFSLLPIIGVLLHTGAFWMDDEKKIRIVSFLGSPFWLVYNYVSGAYGSCIGDILSIVSLVISMVRFDIAPKMKERRIGK